MHPPKLLPPFAGNTFEVRYEGLTATNAYADDGIHMRYAITEGPLPAPRAKWPTPGSTSPARST